MPIWVFMVRYEGEMACTTHFTEKGAMLAAIGDMLEYLGVEDEEDAQRVYNSYGGIAEGEQIESPAWDQEKMRKMNINELNGIFGEWVEKTWDSHEYDVEITKTMVRA